MSKEKEKKKKTEIEIETEEKEKEETKEEAGAEEEEAEAEAETADADEAGDGSGDEKKESGAEGEKKDPRDLKIEELNDKHMRLMAEFENFRKRSGKEKEAMFETGAKSVIEKILPVVDNFERALGMSDEAGEDKPEKEADPFMEGMRMVYKQLITELEGIGVKPIDAIGKEFDPAFHNAVMQEESESQSSGTILKELQKGYLYRDSVVRHSMVSVAK